MYVTHVINHVYCIHALWWVIGNRKSIERGDMIAIKKHSRHLFLCLTLKAVELWLPCHWQQMSPARKTCGWNGWRIRTVGDLSCQWFISRWESQGWGLCLLPLRLVLTGGQFSLRAQRGSIDGVNQDEDIQTQITYHVKKPILATDTWRVVPSSGLRSTINTAIWEPLLTHQPSHLCCWTGGGTCYDEGEWNSQAALPPPTPRPPRKCYFLLWYSWDLNTFVLLK